MTALNKQALREAAEKASPGPWRYLKTTPFMDAEISAENHTRVVNLLAGDVTVDNSEFISSANPATVLALLDELEAKDATIATQQQEIRTLLNALEQATDKQNYDITGQKRLIGWRASDYSDETSDPELAKNWAAAIGVLPIFEGDVNTKLTAAGIGVKGE